MYIFQRRTRRVGQCFSAGIFKPLRRILIRQLQYSHTRFVSLLFYLVAGQQSVNYGMSILTNLVRPSAETVTVPLYILLMNDMEAFADQDSLITHKGNLNDDVNISRKNVAVALLYNIASKHDKTIVANGSYSDIVKLMNKYKVLDFVVSETELFYSKIIEDYQKSTFEKTWISNFIIFMQDAKTKAYQKLGLT